MASGGARDMTLARLLSHPPDSLKKGGERESGPAPKHQKFMCSNVCVLGVHLIKMHTFTHKELFPPHSVNTAPLINPLGIEIWYRSTRRFFDIRWYRGNLVCV